MFIQAGMLAPAAALAASAAAGEAIHESRAWTKADILLLDALGPFLGTKMFTYAKALQLVERTHKEVHGAAKGEGDVEAMHLSNNDMGFIKARKWLPVSRKEDGSLEPLGKAKGWVKPAAGALKGLPLRLRETLETLAERARSPLWKLDTSSGMLTACGAAGASAPPLPVAAASAAQDAAGAASAAPAPTAATPSPAPAPAPAAAAVAAAPSHAPPAPDDADAEPPEVADVLVQEESSLEPEPPITAPPQTCSWQPSGGSLCASRCRTAGCTTGACSSGHCKQLVLKRGWPACSKHPISHAEFVASGAG